MPYIGNTPAEKYASYDVQHITTSATTSYALDKNVANENEIRVVLNNIIQQPGASYAYTASANTLTLSVATTSSDTLYVVFTGKAVQTVTPPPSSVGLAQLNATGSPGTNTFLRGDNSWATPSDSVSYLVKISTDDTTPNFLNGKLVAGTGISLTEGSGGGDETLTIANTSTGTISAFTNGADNRIVTATSATALNGEANLTYNGTILGVGSGADLGTGISIKTADSGGSVETWADELVIEGGAAGTGMTFLSNNDQSQSINFGDAQDSNAGMLQYSHYANKMVLHAGGSEKLNLTATGGGLTGAWTGVGKVLQVVQNIMASNFTMSSGTNALVSGMNPQITMASTTNKLLVLGSYVVRVSGNSSTVTPSANIFITDVSNVQKAGAYLYFNVASNTHHPTWTVCQQAMWTPGTTSAYDVKLLCNNASEGGEVQFYGVSGVAWTSFTLIEIQA